MPLFLLGMLALYLSPLAIKTTVFRPDTPPKPQTVALGGASDVRSTIIIVMIKDRSREKMKDESLFLVALLDLGRKFERTEEKLNILI